MRFHARASLALLLGIITFAGSSVQAQTTVTYNNLDNISTAYNTTLNNLTLTTESGIVAEQSGVIGGSGIVTKTGAGSLTLSGPNTYSGSTSITAGTIEVSADNNLGTAPGSAVPGHLAIGDPATLRSTATFTLNSNRGIEIPSEGTATISTDSGTTLTYGGIIAGTGNLTKAGLGTLVLSGTNNYYGETGVNFGTLTVNGSITHSSVVVKSGATLDGSGTFNKLVRVENGGIFSPGGNSVGTLTLASTSLETTELSINNGAVIRFDLGTVSDLILISSGDAGWGHPAYLTGPGSGGLASFEFNAASGFGAGTYTLIDHTGIAWFAGSYQPTYFTGAGIAGYTLTFTDTGNLFQVSAVSAVPEPSTYAMFAGISALGLAIVRRRKLVA